MKGRGIRRRRRLDRQFLVAQRCQHAARVLVERVDPIGGQIAVECQQSAGRDGRAAEIQWLAQVVEFKVVAVRAGRGDVGQHGGSSGQ